MFENLTWVAMPSEPGWYFMWYGNKMEIKEIVEMPMTDSQGKVLGGRSDGDTPIKLSELGVRLFAGPLGSDPRKLPREQLVPPVLPESEYYLVEEWKKKEGSP